MGIPAQWERPSPASCMKSPLIGLRPTITGVGLEEGGQHDYAQLKSVQRHDQRHTSMFSDADSLTFHGAQSLTNVSGDYIVQVSESSRPVAIPTIPIREDQRTSESVSERYARTHFMLRNGYAIWYPQPMTSAPQEYREHGVRIGDVVLVSPNGQTDFLFNIMVGKDDPINRRGVPDGFVPISPPEGGWEVNINEDYFTPGKNVLSGSVETTTQQGGIVPSDPVQYTFRCRPREGAILALPEGAIQEDLVNHGSFYTYAAKHAMDWYQYVNQRRDRAASNGSLYLVTGHDKTHVWGTASFSNVLTPEGFPLSYGSTDPSQERRKYSHAWIQSGSASTQTGPALQNCDNEGNRRQNQCVFIRGYKITLAKTIWQKLFVGRATVEHTEESSYNDSPVPFRDSDTPGWQSYLSLKTWTRHGGASHGNERRNSGQAQSAVPSVSHIVPQLSRNLHPSNVINQWLLDKDTGATCAITHDSVWCSAIEGLDSVPDASTLIELVEKKYSIKARNQSLTVEGNPCLKRENTCENLYAFKPRQTLSTLTDFGVITLPGLQEQGRHDDARLKSIQRHVQSYSRYSSDAGSLAFHDALSLVNISEDYISESLRRAVPTISMREDQTTSESVSERYSHIHFRKRNEYAIRHLQPMTSAPQEYREHGTRIGDVGLVSPNGQTDFLFNVMIGKDDPINRRGVPDGFVPISPPEGGWEVNINEDYFTPGKNVLSGSVETTTQQGGIVPSDPVQYTFRCRPREGAILTLERRDQRGLPGTLQVKTRVGLSTLEQSMQSSWDESAWSIFPGQWDDMLRECHNNPAWGSCLLELLQWEREQHLGSYRRLVSRRQLSVSKKISRIPPSMHLYDIHIEKDLTKAGTVDVGGSGYIYKAIAGNHSLCLKAIRVDDVRERRTVMKATLREIIAYKNIVPFCGVTELPGHRGQIALVSPWMAHDSIKTFIHNNPQCNRFRCVKEIIAGLKALHSEDPPIFHRDLKSANILVIPDGTCCIADFGVSSISGSQRVESHTSLGEGTLRWRAPEALMPENLPSLDPQTSKRPKLNPVLASGADLWALGCVIYEIYTGADPYANYAKDVQAIIANAFRHELPGQLPSSCPSVIRDFVHHCWQSKPENRPTLTDPNLARYYPGLFDPSR